MNKRQAKKQFKKKYGMNPNDYYLICNMDVITENVRKLCNDIAETMPKVLEEWMEKIDKASKACLEFVKSDECKKIIQATKELNEKCLPMKDKDEQKRNH